MADFNREEREMPTETCATPTGPASEPLTVTVRADDLSNVLDELLRRGVPDGVDWAAGRPGDVRFAVFRLAYDLRAANQRANSVPGGA